MIDRFFTLALAAGLLALAVSTVVGFGRGFEGIGPRMVSLDRVVISAKRMTQPPVAGVEDQRR